MKKGIFILIIVFFVFNFLLSETIEKTKIDTIKSTSYEYTEYAIHIITKTVITEINTVEICKSPELILFNYRIHPEQYAQAKKNPGDSIQINRDFKGIDYRVEETKHYIVYDKTNNIMNLTSKSDVQKNSGLIIFYVWLLSIHLMAVLLQHISDRGGNLTKVIMFISFVIAVILFCVILPLNMLNILILIYFGFPIFLGIVGIVTEKRGINILYGIFTGLFCFMPYTILFVHKLNMKFALINLAFMITGIILGIILHKILHKKAKKMKIEKA